jgi:ABC-type uncharacterized transport system involved in gliding motility auxiliary subunit
VKRVLAIARREAGTFFHSAMSPVVLLGFLLLVGLFFTLFTFGFSEMSYTAVRSGQADTALSVAEGVFQPLVSDMAIFLLFLLPAISMRLFAEEYRSGRYDLIMSYPVADHQWVIGKWLSVLAVVVVLLLGAGVYFGVVSVLAQPEPGPLVAAGLGLLLLAAAVAAWGVFFSSLFPYQVVSYILTFAFAMLFFVIDSLEPHAPGLFGNLVRDLSWRLHFVRFSWGVVDSRDLVFLLGWSGVGLSAATAALAGRRQVPGSPFWRWLSPALVAGMVCLVFLLAQRYPWTSDWTQDRRYSLAPQTEQVLAGLTQDVQVTAFYQRLDPQRTAMEVLLRAARDRYPRLRFTVLDPERDLAEVERLGVSSPRTVVVEIGEQRRLLLEPDESTLVNAIYRLATHTQPVVYYLLGHGEHRLDSEERGGYSSFAATLRQQGYELRPLLLPEQPRVPADGEIVVVAAPKLDLSAAEVEALEGFVARGGGLLALLDPGTPESFATWMSRYNVRLMDDFIVSSAGQRRFGVDSRVVVLIEPECYGDHEVTRGLPGQATFFPFTQSLTPLHAAMAGVESTWLLRTGDRSWAEQDPMTVASGQPAFDEGVDRPGPVVFGIAATVAGTAATGEGAPLPGPRQPAPPPSDDPVLHYLEESRAGASPHVGPSVFSRDTSARLVVIGDSDFASNANLGLYGNRDLLLNTLGWLAREQVLVQRRAAPVAEPLILSPTQKEVIGWGAILAWPLLVGGGSGYLVVRHRRRR